MSRPFAWIRFRFWESVVRRRRRALRRAEQRASFWWSEATGMPWGRRP